MNSRTAFVFVAAWLGADHAVCQSPFTLLNPTAAWTGIHAVREGDSVLAFGVAGSTSGFLHLSRSSDGGRTFPVVEQTLAYLGGQFHGNIGGVVRDGVHVYVAVGVPYGGPFVLSSHDGGATWTPGTRVSLTSNALFAGSPQLFVQGLDVAVVWGEVRANGRVWANHSTDGGATWAAQDTRLDAGVVDAGDTLFVTSADGAELHVYWSRPVPLLGLHQASFDGGATWLSTPQVIGALTALRGAGSARVQIVSDLDATTCLRSIDRGATWLPTTIAGMPYVQALAVHDAVILAVGSVAPVPTTDLLLQVSTDAGATWLPVPYAIGWYRSATFQPVATATALGVNCVFGDSRLPRAAFIQSDDLGVSWRLVDDAADSLVLAGDDGCIGIGTVAATSRYQAHVIEGHSRVGTGGGAPLLAGQGLAGLGRTFFLAVTGARANAQGGVFATFDALTNQPVGDQTLYVAMPHIMAPFTADPNGAAAVAVTVPVSTTFAGLRLASQAFAIDAAMPFGFVATHAVETWIQ